MKIISTKGRITKNDYTKYIINILNENDFIEIQRYFFKNRIPWIGSGLCLVGYSMLYKYVFVNDSGESLYRTASDNIDTLKKTYKREIIDSSEFLKSVI